MSNLNIMGNVRRFIQICENICVIPAYGEFFTTILPRTIFLT